MSIPQEINTDEFNKHESRYIVTIDDGVTKIKANQFSGLSLLEEVIIPPSVTKIDEFAFFQCRGLRRLILPDSITNIESNAFDQCEKLGYIKLPDNIVELKAFTFRYCQALTYIAIPASIKKISNLAFYGCSNLSDSFFNSIAPLLYEDEFLSTSKGTINSPAAELKLCRKFEDKKTVYFLGNHEQKQKTYKKRSEHLREYIES